jgi:chemotaxis protein MotB
MARRKREEEQEQKLDRWLVSYADLVTLLFAFFVVMYSFSSINEGKYRVMSESLVSAFRNTPLNALEETPVLPRPLPLTELHNKAQENVKQKRRDTMRNVAKNILEVMEPLIEQGTVRVLETSRGVSIEINDSVLFSPGQALLQTPSIKAMHAVAEVLTAVDFPITIEGHTDNVPISTLQFPSNWELSAVRATTVLRLFLDAGVLPERLTAIGYADTRPVEPNLFAEARARNRRVTIQVDSTIPEKAAEVKLTAHPAERSR